MGGLHERISNWDNVALAVHRAARGRRQKPEVVAYLEKLEEEMGSLMEQLSTGRLHCGTSHSFLIHDPKERLITAPAFRERVLHHAVMNVCGPVLERRQPQESYACRVGKGTFRALEAARCAAGRAPWFLKLDVRKYFDSIPHELLHAALGRVFREERVVGMLMQLVRAYRPGEKTGLAIGTLVSQHLANHYLVRLDSFLLQGGAGRIRGYVRYMDDLAVWFDSGPAAVDASECVNRFTAGHLSLCFKTRFVNRSIHGMDFLGHRVHPHWIGLSRSTRRRHVRELRRLQEAGADGTATEREVQVRATSLYSFIRHARSLGWRRRVVQALEEWPQAEVGCFVVAAGSTTAGTPGPASATATIPATGTTTSVSGPAPAPPDGGSRLMEQAIPPVPEPSVPDETQVPRHRSVAPEMDSLAAKADAGGDCPLFP